MSGVAEGLVRSGYAVVFRSVFAKMDPERAHHLAFAVIKALPHVPFVGGLVERYSRPAAADGITTMGIHFPSRFGLAAGFDKDARGIGGLGLLGFGHVEVGTITAKPQPGNERPRLFRLIEDRALINRMGFNNHGAGAAARRLERARRNPGRPVIGVNIGKSRVVAVEDAIDDYLESTRRLAPFADYLAVNVSSPNTPGLRGLQELDQLRPLLSAVRDAAGDTPVLVKIAPDLTDEQVDAIAGLAVSLGLSGIIANNTTISREGLAADPADVEAMGAGDSPALPWPRARSRCCVGSVPRCPPSSVSSPSAG
ncbi:quinone-dependent dihydroorotate dehydrogenase [Sphingomonas sp. LR61]|uniref:quinone-dependent dihydroorotate dehydrogenase n=1 Tax=Sphingomonas sp. LR61 TaxID=3050234 RepID=UPI002FE175D2